MRKKIKMDQFAELAAAVVRSLPRDINPNSAQYWIVNQGELGERLKTALIVAEYEESELPTEMTVGGRVYEILSFLREEDGGSVRGDVMVSRAKELGANLGKEDCEFILAHQADIPVALRGKIVFVFPDWRSPVDREDVAYVGWGGDGWYQFWGWLASGWLGFDRLLRRK